MKRGMIGIAASIIAVSLLAGGNPVTDGLILDLDASAASSMSLSANNEVLTWTSVAGDGTVFEAGEERIRAILQDVYKKNVTFNMALPYLTTDGGLPAVRFGATYDGAAAYNLMATRTPVQAKTTFVVNRQPDIRVGTAIFGKIFAYDTRLLRHSDANNGWKAVNYSTIWVNGKRTNLFPGTTTPHAVVVRSDEAVKEIETLGASYVYQVSAASEPSIVYNKSYIHEVVSYSRALSDDEVDLVQEWLMAKWGLAATAVWTGEGATTDWNDADNWKGGRIPCATDNVLLGSAAVTASGTCEAARIFADDATLTLADGARVSATGAFGLSFAGSGRVDLYGRTVCPKDNAIATTLDLHVYGCLDLNGTTQNLPPVDGGGTLVNSSATKAAVVVDTASAAAFDVKVSGSIDLVKRGEGTLTLAPIQDYAGETTVSAGKLGVRDGVLLSGYGRMTLHIDASAPETLSLNADNQVLAWRSQTDNGVVMQASALAFPNEKFRKAYAVKRTISERDCVYFQYADTDSQTSVTGAFLQATHEIRNRTLFFVLRQFSSYGNGTVFGSTYDIKGRIIRDTTAAFAYKTAEVSGTTLIDEGWINGQNKTPGPYDFAPATASGILPPHLLVVRRQNVMTNSTVGAAWLAEAPGGEPKMPSAIFGNFDLHEAIAFEEALTDRQIEEISAALIEKWSVPKEATVVLSEAKGRLSPNTAYTVSDGATLDLGRQDQTVQSVSGSGTVAFSGRHLKLSEGSDDDSALKLEAYGSIDLNGQTLAVASVTGAAAFTNTADAVATVIADNDESAFFDATMTGNVNLEKSGAGTLALVGGQSPDGELRLAGGTVAVSDGVDLSSYGHLTVHLDARRADTFQLDPANGNVLSWKSLSDNGMVFLSAEATYQGNPIRTGYTWRLQDAAGRPCVRFGLDQNNVYTGSYLRASMNIPGRTLFFVNRQIEGKGFGTMIGNVFNYTDRIYRNQDEWNRWNTKNVPEGWISGEKSETLSYATSTTAAPHVLAVRRTETAENETLGACWMRDGGPTAGLKDYTYLYAQMDLYEVVIYDTALTDEQILAVSGALMKKWNVPVPTGVTPVYPSNPLSADATVVVQADATLDFGGYDQVLSGLVFDAGIAGLCPTLSVIGSLDVTGTALEFRNLEGQQKCDFLMTTGALTGPFASCTGLDSSYRVTYRPRKARISNGGMVLIFR